MDGWPPVAIRREVVESRHLPDTLCLRRGKLSRYRFDDPCIPRGKQQLGVRKMSTAEECKRGTNLSFRKLGFGSPSVE